MHDLFKEFWVAGLLLVTLLYAGGKAAGQQAPAAPSDQASQQLRQMQQVEDRWSDAVNKRDQFEIELVLAPQFIDISATGDVTTRNQQIAALFVKNAEPVSTERKAISARFVGNVAIVNGTYAMRWKLGKGPVDEKGVFSHVFEHTAAGWLCLNAQQTVVAEGGKQAAAIDDPKSRSSNAALSMHIPMAYKGPAGSQPAPAAGSNAPPN